MRLFTKNVNQQYPLVDGKISANKPLARVAGTVLIAVAHEGCHRVLG
jgi:hypothetical protein